MQSDIKMIDLFQNTEKKPVEQKYDPQNLFSLIRGCDRMVVGFTTTCAISAYRHSSCEYEPRSWRGVLDTTLCDKVCQ
jgi:hypothetical protein